MLAKCKWGPARPSRPGSSRNDTNFRLHGASPKGACWVEFRCAATFTRRCYRTGWGAVSGDQAELPRPRDGLGPVGGAELAQDVGHVLFDSVERHHQVVGDALVRLALGDEP